MPDSDSLVSLPLADVPVDASVIGRLRSRVVVPFARSCCSIVALSSALPGEAEHEA